MPRKRQHYDTKITSENEEDDCASTDDHADVQAIGDSQSAQRGSTARQHTAAAHRGSKGRQHRAAAQGGSTAKCVSSSYHHRERERGAPKQEQGARVASATDTPAASAVAVGDGA